MNVPPAHPASTRHEPCPHRSDPSEQTQPVSPMHAALRPRDAASILLIDRSGPSPRILVGRRDRTQIFMPDVYVFPGGRRDPRDHALPVSDDLDARVLARLMAPPFPRSGVSRARALALAALRELQEETGISVTSSGRFDLSPLRYVARAVTPPGHVRRYDARFFAAFMDEMMPDMSGFGDTGELGDLQWLDIAADSGLKLPRITQTVLEDLKSLLNADPALPHGASVPFYFMRRGHFVRSRL